MGSSSCLFIMAHPSDSVLVIGEMWQHFFAKATGLLGIEIRKVRFRFFRFFRESSHTGQNTVPGGGAINEPTGLLS